MKSGLPDGHKLAWLKGLCPQGLAAQGLSLILCRPSFYNIPMTHHRVIFGNSRNMKELSDESVHLIVTSPPYYNAPYDYEDLFPSYEDYLALIRDFASESWRVLEKGRIAAVNTDDMLVNGKRYPIVADTTKIFIEAGFTYRDRITWKKPEGYIRISRRSGVLLQHPWPMYYYPDNIQESILIFQKGKADYKALRAKRDEDDPIEKEEYLKGKWYLNLWEMTNRLPNQTGNWSTSEYPAAFPDELAYRLIRLFSYRGETVLDPFLGSGTTSRVAAQLGRNSVGYELLPNLKQLIETRILEVAPDAKLSFTTRSKRRKRAKV